VLFLEAFAAQQQQAAGGSAGIDLDLFGGRHGGGLGDGGETRQNPKHDGKVQSNQRTTIHPRSLLIILVSVSLLAVSAVATAYCACHSKG